MCSCLVACNCFVTVLLREPIIRISRKNMYTQICITVRFKTTDDIKEKQIVSDVRF